MRATAFLSLGVLVLFPLILLGCGSDEPAAPASGPLENVSLSSPTAVSLQRVRLQGLPVVTVPSGYRVIISAGASLEVERSLAVDAMGPFFWAPLHPVAPNEGGELIVRITDGEKSSPELRLDLAPLPEAAGSFGALVSALRDHVDQRAIWAGVSFASLSSQEFDEVAPGLLPLKVAQSSTGTVGEEVCRAMVSFAGPGPEIGVEGRQKVALR